MIINMFLTTYGSGSGPYDVDSSSSLNMSDTYDGGGVSFLSFTGSEELTSEHVDMVSLEGSLTECG